MLKFDPETHTYTLDEKKLPSVTEILNAEGLILQNNDPWYMLRGKYLHEAVKMHLQGILDPESLDPILTPYFRGFEAFLTTTGFVVQGFETPYYHPQYKFAGTPDIIGELNGKLTFIEIKTGNPAKWHILQLSAYMELLQSNGIKIQDGAILYLDDGKYNLRLTTMRELQQGLLVFLSALTLYRYKKEELWK